MLWVLGGHAVWLAIGFIVYSLISRGYPRPHLFWVCVAVLFWPYLLTLLYLDRYIDKNGTW